jgi:hypothetical protein
MRDESHHGSRSAQTLPLSATVIPPKSVDVVGRQLVVLNLHIVAPTNSANGKTIFRRSPDRQRTLVVGTAVVAGLMHEVVFDCSNGGCA